MPPVDMEEGGLNTLVGLTEVADFQKRRPCQQENVVWTTRKVGQ